MTLSKNKGFKTPQIIESDIRYGFNKIIAQRRPIYLLTISNTQFTEPKHLQFIIRSFFNRIRKEMKTTINYLSVIEYPEKVSHGNRLPDNCKIHAHIILETDMLESDIERMVFQKFNNRSVIYSENGWFDLRNISERRDKYRLVDYLLKQKEIFTDSSYEYKIEMN